MFQRPVTFLTLALAASSAMAVEARANDLKAVTDALITVCVGGGTSDQVEASASGDTKLTLKALRSGDVGGSAGIAGKYSKSEWLGLQGGISSSLSQMQADQADKVRECLKPYMPGIVQAILQSQ